MPVKYGVRLLLLVVPVFVCGSQTRSIAQPPALPTVDDYPALQAFPLDKSGEHMFHFRADQNGEMTLLLKIEGSTGEPDRQELTHLHIVMEAKLVNHAGHTVCQAVGSPKDGVSADNWVLRTSRGEAAFWHRNCAEIKLKRSESYLLTIRVRDADPEMPKIKATPVFEHSDNYSP
ncbi:MAG: hypothetical protein WB987_10720 [Candidatus Acidiferrales bacterium]